MVTKPTTASINRSITIAVKSPAFSRKNGINMRVENTDMPIQRPMMEAIRDRLTAITEGRDSAYDHWVTRVRLDG